MTEGMHRHWNEIRNCNESSVNEINESAVRVRTHVVSGIHLMRSPFNGAVSQMNDLQIVVPFNETDPLNRV